MPGDGVGVKWKFSECQQHHHSLPTGLKTITKSIRLSLVRVLLAFKELRCGLALAVALPARGAVVVTVSFSAIVGTPVLRDLLRLVLQTAGDGFCICGH